MPNPRNCKHMVALYLRCDYCEEEDALRVRVALLEATLVHIRANREHLSLNQIDKLITETLGR